MAGETPSRLPSLIRETAGALAETGGSQTPERNVGGGEQQGVETTAVSIQDYLGAEPLPVTSDDFNSPEFAMLRQLAAFTFRDFGIFLRTPARFPLGVLLSKTSGTGTPSASTPALPAPEGQEGEESTAETSTGGGAENYHEEEVVAEGDDIASTFYENWNEFLIAPNSFPLGALLANQASSSGEGGSGGKATSTGGGAVASTAMAIAGLAVLGAVLAMHLPAILNAIVRITEIALPIVGGIINRVVDVVQTLVSAVAPYIGPLLMTIAEAIKTLVDAVAPYIGPILTKIVDFLGQGFLSIIAGLRELATGIIGIIRTLVEAVAPYIGPILTKLVDILGEVVTAILELGRYLMPYLGPLITVITEALALVVETIKALMPVIIPVLEVIAEAIKQIVPIITGVIKVIGEGLQMIIPSLSTFISRLLDVFSSDFIQLLKTVFRGLSTVVEAMGKFFENALGGVGAAVGGVGNLVGSVFNGAAEGLTGFIDRANQRANAKADAEVVVMEAKAEAEAKMQVALAEDQIRMMGETFGARTATAIKGEELKVTGMSVLQTVMKAVELGVMLVVSGILDLVVGIYSLGPTLSNIMADPIASLTNASKEITAEQARALQARGVNVETRTNSIGVTTYKAGYRDIALMEGRQAGERNLEESLGRAQRFMGTFTNSGAGSNQSSAQALVQNFNVSSRAGATPGYGGR